MKKESTYTEVKPLKDLNDFIHSFWIHNNLSGEPEKMTIFPDGFFKIIFFVSENQIVNYLITGLWTEGKEIVIPSNTSSVGCRLKVLAPEFLLNEKVASLLNTQKQLELSYLNIEKIDLSDSKLIIKQWEKEFKKKLSTKSIQEKKLKLSQLLYKMKGSISASELSEQVSWSNRQINRYLNKYLGISLKKYLNIQKCYESYFHIREGRFFPEQGYFDQAHFVREIKKHTSETPTTLYKNQSDRFIQLKNIQKK